jgi:hypothetical protein
MAFNKNFNFILLFLNSQNLIINFIFYYFQIRFNIFNLILWGLGDWGLGIGDWGLGPIPNPQSPIPNPQSPNPH